MENKLNKLLPKSARGPRRRTRCMFKDEKGIWWLDFYLPNGKRRRKKCGKSKADADRELRLVHTVIDKGEFVDTAASPTFREFVDLFMKRYGDTKVSYRKNKRIFTRFKEFFGTTRLTKISSAAIELYREQRRKDTSLRDGKSPLSLSSIDREVEVLRAMLGMALKWKMVGRNVAYDVADYGVPNGRDRVLTSDEIARLLRATKPRKRLTSSPLLRPVVYLALQTGMRKAELLGLRWNDVNFESAQIVCTKTKNGDQRRVPMSRRARWLLRKMAARNPLNEFVFQSKTRKGVISSAQDVKTAWVHALRVARIENFRFHDLRHTFASIFAMKNGNVFALSKILGHRNPMMTVNRYSHLSQKYIDEQKSIMDAPYKSAPEIARVAAVGRV